jgi:acetyl esterase/lipase
VEAFPIWTKTVPVSYGPSARQQLDLIRPRWTRVGPRPVAAVFHGGGWLDGSKSEMLDRVCRRYVEQGFLVANVEYRYGLATSTEDAVRALEWVSAHAREYGGDPRRLMVTGESAGGHLALMAALTSGVPVRAIVNFYGVSDLQELLKSRDLRHILPPEESPQAAAIRFSPVSYVGAGLWSVLSIHNDMDPVVPRDQTSRLTKRIREAGGSAEEWILAGRTHGLSEPQSEITYRRVFDFLRRQGLF